MGIKYKQINNTPLSISVYSVEKTVTAMHPVGQLEIIFCLKGSVSFSYAHEDLTLNAGEYISVDRDAYYLYNGKDNICVSFLFDLSQFRYMYNEIENVLFVCENCSEVADYYRSNEHRLLKGMLLGLLRYLINSDAVVNCYSEEIMRNSLNQIIELFLNRFDISFSEENFASFTPEILNNIRKATSYMQKHKREKLSLADVAATLNFSESYMSEYLSKYTAGYRNVLSYFRANDSERLLLETDKTILEISEECGFSDVKYYQAAFKKWYKRTPKQFRNQYRKSDEEIIEYIELNKIGKIVDEMIIEYHMKHFVFENFKI